MAKTFKFEIITPERVVYSDAVFNVAAEGTEGSFGILAGHAPLITELQTSIVTINDANNKAMRFALDKGFLEVFANTVSVLTDRCVKEGDVDVEKTRAEKDSAEKALAEVKNAEEKTRVQSTIKRANTWLKLANK